MVQIHRYIQDTNTQIVKVCSCFPHFVGNLCFLEHVSKFDPRSQCPLVPLKSPFPSEARLVGYDGMWLKGGKTI